MYIIRSGYINGMELNGSKVIAPKIRTFLERRGAKIEQEDGFITLSGTFSFSSDDVKREIFGITTPATLAKHKSSFFSTIGNFLSMIALGTSVNLGGISVHAHRSAKVRNLYNYGIDATLGSLIIEADYFYNTEFLAHVMLYKAYCAVSKRFKTAFAPVLRACKHVYHTGYNSIKDASVAIVNEVSRIYANIAARFRLMLQLALKKTLDTADSVAQLLISIYAAITHAIMQAINAALYGIQRTVKAIEYGVEQTFNGIAYGAERTINAIDYAIQQTASGLFRATMYVTQPILNIITMIVNAVVNALDFESTPSETKPSASPSVCKAAEANVAAAVDWLADAGKYFVPSFAARSTASHSAPTSRASHSKKMRM